MRHGTHQVGREVIVGEVGFAAKLAMHQYDPNVATGGLMSTQLLS
jgi:hypothetical protein